jgi:hypothetical protein
MMSRTHALNLLAVRAHVVTGAGILDPDHLGAETGEQPSAVVARKQSRQVENADAIKWQRRRCAHTT